MMSLEALPTIKKKGMLKRRMGTWPESTETDGAPASQIRDH